MTACAWLNLAGLEVDRETHRAAMKERRAALEAVAPKTLWGTLLPPSERRGYDARYVWARRERGREVKACLRVTAPHLDKPYVRWCRFYPARHLRLV